MLLKYSWLNVWYYKALRKHSYTLYYHPLYMIFKLLWQIAFVSCIQSLLIHALLKKKNLL